jgi:23S rRNA (pseudouridine1915-N3)-methyltransferase
MTAVRLIAVGQKMPAWVEAGCQEYLPRFRHQFRLTIETLPASKYAGKPAQEDHERRLLGRLKSSDFLVLLDERGVSFTTESLAHQLTQWELTGRSMVFAIGGADGWAESTRQRADGLWSLSQLVFPHPLVRLLVIEQLYRADTVRQGHPYHRG